GFEEDFYFIYPTKEWQSKLISPDDISEWEIDTDRFYIDVEILNDN
ncbi:MAG: hypothetical protein GWP19_05120, partial [Planctomycetia bacterium]|nr:hypothetical protein [Planctomycetia bacterium]